MNKCRYCTKEMVRSLSSGFYICNCEKGKKDWKINIDIQMLKRQLKIKQKELNDLKEKEGENAD